MHAVSERTCLSAYIHTYMWCKWRYACVVPCIVFVCVFALMCVCICLFVYLFVRLFACWWQANNRYPQQNRWHVRMFVFVCASYITVVRMILYVCISKFICVCAHPLTLPLCHSTVISGSWAERLPESQHALRPINNKNNPSSSIVLVAYC